MHVVLLLLTASTDCLLRPACHASVSAFEHLLWHSHNFQVAAPDAFVFTKPNEWLKWIRRFERFRLASALDEKADAVQINTLIYAMGDEVTLWQDSD